MALPPGLEARSHGSEQAHLLWRSLQICSAAEKANPQLRVPADVVPSAQLALEEPGKQEALSTGGFHHRAIVPQARVEYEMVEHLGQRGRRRQIDGGLRRYPSVVRKHTGVVQQFLVIDGWFRDLLQTPNEKLERLLFPRSE